MGFPIETKVNTTHSGRPLLNICWRSSGKAVASQLDSNNKKQHIAVIGDGALMSQAFEALNHAGIEKSNLLVILNDNCMSIDPVLEL